MDRRDHLPFRLRSFLPRGRRRRRSSSSYPRVCRLHQANARDDNDGREIVKQLGRPRIFFLPEEPESSLALNEIDHDYRDGKSAV